MEPLSAISLACNILQVVEYGAKILSKAAEYRSAADEALGEHATLRDVLQSLKGLKVDKQSAFESLRMSIKSLWYEDKIKSIKLALADAKDNLNIA